MDSAWVRVLLLDDNDNAPRFTTSQVNLTLPEDTPLGHSLASFTATDIDQVSDTSSLALLHVPRSLLYCKRPQLHILLSNYEAPQQEND